MSRGTRHELGAASGPRRRLRATLVAVSLFALWAYVRLPVAPPGLAGACLSDTFSDRVTLGVVAGLIAIATTARLSRGPRAAWRRPRAPLPAAYGGRTLAAGAGGCHISGLLIAAAEPWHPRSR